MRQFLDSLTGLRRFQRGLATSLRRRTTSNSAPECVEPHEEIRAIAFAGFSTTACRYARNKPTWIRIKRHVYISAPDWGEGSTRLIYPKLGGDVVEAKITSPGVKRNDAIVIYLKKRAAVEKLVAMLAEKLDENAQAGRSLPHRHTRGAWDRHCRRAAYRYHRRRERVFALPHPLFQDSMLSLYAWVPRNNPAQIDAKEYVDNILACMKALGIDPQRPTVLGKTTMIAWIERYRAAVERMKRTKRAPQGPGYRTAPGLGRALA